MRGVQGGAGVERREGLQVSGDGLLTVGEVAKTDLGRKRLLAVWRRLNERWEEACGVLSDLDLRGKPKLRAQAMTAAAGRISRSLRRIERAEAKVEALLAKGGR